MAKLKITETVSKSTPEQVEQTEVFKPGYVVKNSTTIFIKYSSKLKHDEILIGKAETAQEAAKLMGAQ